MRVLVFECDRRVPGALLAWLASEGHTVRVASDPLAAIAQPDTAAPDVLVLSAMAGSEEALDLCRELRRSTSVPILVVGDSTEVEDSIRALDAGADDYLAPTTSQPNSGAFPRARPTRICARAGLLRNGYFVC